MIDYINDERLKRRVQDSAPLIYLKNRELQKEVLSKLWKVLKQKAQVVSDEIDSHKSAISFLTFFKKTIQTITVVKPGKASFDSVLSHMKNTIKLEIAEAF